MNIIIALFLSFRVFASTDISGEVTLAKGVTLKPGGVLYVFAKRPGVPMPVAVLRVPEPKLPYKFSVSEKNILTPGTPFDGPFIITARFSPSGDAMDKSGVEGSVNEPVKVGKSDLKIELKGK